MALSFLFLLLLSTFLSSISSSPITTIPISFLNQKLPNSINPYQLLTQLASTSLARAHHLKNPKNAPPTATPLRPYTGGYSISLSFGTPPQSIPMIMDTGSSFSWFPCTKSYICKNCSVSSTFMPKQSSSAKIIGCQNPKCSWVHTSFDPKTTNCSQICPPYMIMYGLGSTGGVAMVETLHLPSENIENFLVGCSIFSSDQPAGVAGFGRGISSFPSQLKIKKFSYCSVSHKFVNTVKTSWLKMDTVYDSGRKSTGVKYTPLLKNPVKLPDYYYIGLKRIVIGGRKVEVFHENLVPDSNGNGGTIVDSGSTFTYANRVVFDTISNALAEQVKGYDRAKNVEVLTGLRPCFDVTGRKGVKMPDMELHFKGGAEMRLPLENVFVAVDDDGEKAVVCLAMVTDNTVLGPELVSGPSVILGNFMTQNFEVEYDLRNQRFGFRQQTCS